jgi:hypothetical protein
MSRPYLAAVAVICSGKCGCTVAGGRLEDALIAEIPDIEASKGS